MAKRVVNYVVLIDDLDGTELPRGEGQTIRYGWRGSEYEIDLSDKHANDLDTMMGNLVSKSVKVGKMLPHRPHTPGKAKAQAVEKANETPALPAAPPNSNGSYNRMVAGRELRKEIRVWARENGWAGLGDTGRIPEDVRAAWDEAHPDRPVPAETKWR